MASPPEGEKPPVEFEVAAFWFHNAAENVAEEIVSEIVTRAQEVLHERVTTARAATVSANCLMEHLLSHLDACFMRHDKGEIGAGESDWEFEPEPRPALADSWSRNAIAQRRKRKPKVEENQFVGDEKPAARRRPQGTPLQTVEEGKSNPPETIPIRMPTPIDDPEEDALRNQKGREMKRKQEEEAKQRRKQKEEEEVSKQLEKLRAELRSRPYSFDSEGKIVFVHNFDASRLPPSHCNVPYRLSGKPEDSSSQQFSASPRRAPGASRKKERGQASGGAGGGGDEAERFMRKIASQQPPIFDSIELSQGVTLHDGGRSKQGPAPQEDPSRVSWKSYREGVGVSSLSGVVSSGVSQFPQAPNTNSVSMQQQQPDSTSAHLMQAAAGGNRKNSQQQSTSVAQSLPEDNSSQPPPAN